MTDDPPAANDDLRTRLERLEEIVESNHLALSGELTLVAARAGVPDDEPHQLTARKEANIVRAHADNRIDLIVKAHEEAFELGRAETLAAKKEVLSELVDVKAHSTELSLAAGVAAGRAAAVVEERLTTTIGENKTLVKKLQTSVEEIQGNVTIVLTALVSMQKTNMKMLGAAVLIGGVLIFILSRALGF